MNTAEDVAARLRLSRITVQRYCRRGLFPGAVKAGNRWRIPEQALIAFLADASVAA
jgi:excisionase family DNA binding protein